MTRIPTVLSDLGVKLAEPDGGARVVRGRPGRRGRKAAVLILCCELARAGIRPAS